MNLKRVSLLVFIIIISIAGGLLWWSYHALTFAKEHASADEYITIPRGMAPTQIIQRLAEKGIVAKELPLLVYMRATGTGARLKAGEYKFPSPITPLEVLRRLEEGQQRLSRFTVIEGWTRWDVAAAMARIPELNLKDQATALKLLDNRNLIADIDPSAVNLEGYLYPDTYSFPPDTTGERIVALMVERFREVWHRQSRAAQNSDRTPREIVTIASLIETEAKLKGERPLVSSVVYNRLERGMALGIDSTVIYASKLAGKWRGDGKVYQSDLDRESPYNTRKNLGLPPGPIASPGESSISAALNPAKSDFLYYVRNPNRDDGAHNFYADEAGFMRGVQTLRQWERDRDATQQ
jgi:UPF0755 protein